ncbi:hypothetical protein IH779_00220 [Patescibacteria group bacterium]|nr:hypothetical protein [Patescibacteria group bacterium]
MAKHATIEAREFLPRIEADIDQRFLIVSFFLLIMLVSSVGFKILLPDILFLLVALVALSSIPVDLFIKSVKEKNPQTAINYYFSYLLFDLFVLTLIVNFIGGISWIIPSIYLFYIVTIFWLFPKAQAIFLLGFTIFLLILLVAGNYSGILPHFTVFSIEDKNPQNLNFVLLTTIAALSILVFLGYSGDIFYRLLDKKIKELQKKGKQLLLTKKILEDEVENKTVELQEERKEMEELVEEKTRELEEKKNIVAIKVKELEKFHKTAIARELKMAEIKEKIANIKEFKSK